LLTAGAPGAGEVPAKDGSGGGVESATCAEQSGASFPNAFGRPDNLVVGPVAFSALRRGTRNTTRQDLILFGGVKSPAILRPGHTVTVSVDRSARSFARVSHAQFGRSGFRAYAHTVRFESCSRRRSQSTVDGRPVTFWSGFFLLRKVPACLPLTITVDRQAPRHRSLPVGGGKCEEPRVLVPRVAGLTRGQATARLRQAGLRSAIWRGAVRYEPVGSGLDLRLKLVRGFLAGPRRVTIQHGFPSRIRLPWGSPVVFGTQPAPGRFRFLRGLTRGAAEGLRSVVAGPGGRDLTLWVTGRSCDPLDHVDIALRKRWVLLTPVVIGGTSCRGGNRRRRAELRLPEPLGGRPVLERPPDTPNPSLVNQHPTPFDAARPSPDGRSVVVFYTYGGCNSLAGSRVTEGRETVEITLLQGDTGSAQFCPAIAYFGLAVVELPSPLGGRRIVDGAH
jgi:hypothetical protein